MPVIYSGEICEIDAPRGYVKVKVIGLGIVTEWIPFGRQFTQGSTQSFPITVNTQVLVCEEFSGRWFVLCATPNDVDKPYVGASASKWGAKFSNGALIEYDIAANTFTINAPTSMVNVTGLSVRITAPDITLEGAVTIAGELTAAAGLSISAGSLSVADGGDITAGGVSFLDHTHSGVQTGAGVSGPPIPGP